MKGEEELLAQRDAEHRASALGQPLKSLDELAAEVCRDQPTQQLVSRTLPNLSGANVYAKIRAGLALVDTESAKPLLDV